MTHNSSSTSFSSLNFPSSTASDSSACSSPSSSPSPASLPQDVVQCIVPFVWEKKPGVTKPIKAIQGPCSSSSSSSALESNTISSIVYDESLQFAPLRLPPRLSEAFLSQSRVRESKLSSAQAFMIRRRPHQARPKKPKEEEDPFFLALKACTKVEGTCNAISKEERASFDGLQTAFRGLFKPVKKDQQIMGGTRSAQKVADHQSSEKSLGKSHKRGKLSSLLLSAAKEGGKASSNGSLHTLISANERGKATSNASLMPALISDHVKMGKASSNGSFKRVGSRNSGKELGGSLRGSATRRNTDLHGQSIDANTKGARNKRTKDAVQGKAKQRAQVVEFNACGYGGTRAKNDHHDRHLSSKHIMLTDLLGCRTIQPLNGSAINLSLIKP